MDARAGVCSRVLLVCILSTSKVSSDQITDSAAVVLWECLAAVVLWACPAAVILWACPAAGRGVAGRAAAGLCVDDVMAMA